MRLLDRLLLWSYLEGSHSCAGCRDLVDDSADHDLCCTPVERHPDVAFSLLPPAVVYIARRSLRAWRVQQLRPQPKRGGFCQLCSKLTEGVERCARCGQVRPWAN